jgi:hypothetical protein
MLRLNLKNRAVSQTTQRYNSMCLHRGVPLAATDKGLLRIGGYTDSGEPIPAKMKSGKFDLGADNIKRFRYFYFGVRGNGDLKLTIWADDKLVREYVVPVEAHRGRQEIRVMVGRGVAARYWQWQIENIGGSFFTLYSVRALPCHVLTGQRGG